MRISVLDARHVGEDKKGAPVYIQEVIECQDLYDLAAVCLKTHIAVSVFADNYRCGANWQSCDMVAIDFDDGKLSSKELNQQLSKENMNHVILASKNHLKDKGDGRGIIERFHLFVPFDQTITTPELYGSIALNLCKIFKWQPDAATTKDKCRYYYKHRDALFIHEDGKNLSVSKYEGFKAMQDKLASIKQDTSAKIAKAKKVESPAIDTFKRTRYYKMLERGDLNCDGSRYGNSNIIIGAMIKCRLPIDEALSLFDQFSTYGKGFTRDSIADRFAKFGG